MFQMAVLVVPPEHVSCGSVFMDLGNFLGVRSWNVTGG